MLRHFNVMQKNKAHGLSCGFLAQQLAIKSGSGIPSNGSRLTI